MNMEFKEIIKDIMIDLNLTQAELAKKLGVKSGQLSEWVNGISKPGFDKLKLICEKLEISGDRILGLDIKM